MPYLPDIILQAIIRYQNTDSGHILDESCNLRYIRILNVPMCHFRVLCDAGEMLAVNINQ